jgi:Flp pilus assembly protein TadD
VNSFAIRSALVVLALLAVAWLGFGVRDTRLQSDADAVLAKARTGPVPRAEVDTAVAEYNKAGRLSPDQAPLISQGNLLLAVGRAAEARAVARRATAAEPDNLQAWLLKWQAAYPKTPAKAHAKAEVLRLNPWFLYVLTRRSPQ